MAVVRGDRTAVLGNYWRNPEARHESDFERIIIYLVRLRDDCDFGDAGRFFSRSLALAEAHLLGSRGRRNSERIRSVNKFHCAGIRREGVSCHLADFALSAG